MLSYFFNKRCFIVSKHQKEEVIAPLFETRLGMQCIANTTIDTDCLGTFTGEIERLNDPLTTVKEKCLLASALPNIDFIVANEGSFGPHPLIPFLTAGEEYICLYDKCRDKFTIEKMLFHETNFSSQTIKEMDQLSSVLSKLKFPSHGVILSANEQIVKNINDPFQLRQSVNSMLHQHGRCTIETDMRAMRNPTRMQCIGKLTNKLVDTLLSTCNQCGLYGFGVIEHLAGLKCGLCRRPTKSTLYQLYRCSACGFEKKKIYPNQKYQEDPTFCDWCNP